MNLDELRALVTRGESENVEFKLTTGQRTEAAKTVCALLNGLGGFVFFGVSDRGELIGQQVVPKTLEDITHELRKIDPPAFPSIETVTLEADSSIIETFGVTHSTSCHREKCFCSAICLLQGR